MLDFGVDDHSRMDFSRLDTEFHFNNQNSQATTQVASNDKEMRSRTTREVWKTESNLTNIPTARNNAHGK